MEAFAKNAHRASNSNLNVPQDFRDKGSSVVDDGNSFDSSDQSSQQQTAQQRDDLSSKPERIPAMGAKKKSKRGKYLNMLFGTSEKMSANVPKAPLAKPGNGKLFPSTKHTDSNHVSFVRTFDNGGLMTLSTETSGATLGDSGTDVLAKACNDISISSLQRDGVSEGPSDENDSDDYLTNINSLTLTHQVPSSVASYSFVLSSSSSISANSTPQVPNSAVSESSVLSSSSSISATSSIEDLADETTADEKGADTMGTFDASRRQSFDHNTSIDPDSLSHQEDNKQKGNSLSLPDHHYNLAKHAPKYSESEMQAQIEEAILNTEKEWIEKMKSLGLSNDEQNEMERRMKEQVNRIRQGYEEELKTIYEERDKLLEVQRKEFLEKVAKQEANPLESKGSDPADVERLELLRKIVSLESQLKAEVTSYERRVGTVRQEHATEIEELLAQLDLVEAEHKEKIDELQLSVNQKDAIVSALGKQLADATAKRTMLEQTLTRYTNELDATRKQTAQIQMLAKSQEETIERMKTNHEKAMEEERSKRRLAFEKVKREMIAVAEDQFAKANEHYKKLKAEYETIKDNLAEAEKEIAKTNSEAEAALKARKSREVEVLADVAQLKAALAASEANAARTIQKHNAEIEEMRATENLLKEKLDEAIDNCTAAHRSLANTVAEKERMSRENAEMNAVCEELMAMVEGSTNTNHPTLKR